MQKFISSTIMGTTYAVPQDYDYCLVSTPDLLAAHAPNGKWLPNPIMIQEIESIPKKKPISRILKIAHYPYTKTTARKTTIRTY